jgi:hypothetical protein
MIRFIRIIIHSLKYLQVDGDSRTVRSRAYKPDGLQTDGAVQLAHSIDIPVQNGAYSLTGGGLSQVLCRLRLPGTLHAPDCTTHSLQLDHELHPGSMFIENLSDR